MLRRSLISMLAALGALALAPAVSSAADTYVNGDGGDDANNCTVISTPCETIGQGLIQAGPDDTVHVDDKLTGNYVESQVLSDGKDLLATNIDGSAPGPHTISGTIGPTITVATLEPGSTVTGFLLQEPPTGGMTVDVQSAATFRDNTINNGDADQTTMRISAPAGTGAMIDDNDFNGDNTTTTAAIQVVGDGSPQIINNNIGSPGNGYNFGVRVNTLPNPTITGNTFSAIKEDDVGGPGTAILIQNAQATIRRNVIDQFGGGDVVGIGFLQSAPFPTGGTVSGNLIRGTGTGFGIQVQNTTLPVSLDSNQVSGFITGLDASGSSVVGSTEGDVGASNMTFADNSGSDIAVFNTHVTLDSSIVEEAISVSGPGDPGCTITFSRGPSTLPGACTQFQTTADPGFVNAGSGDYHLLASSPMVDAGNTAAPPADSVDYDGDARAIDADGACPLALRRDIGADELFQPTPDCTPKATPPPAKAKCKKKKKKKKKGKSSAAAAKKKKKKGCKKKKRKKK